MLGRYVPPLWYPGGMLGVCTLPTVPGGMLGVYVPLLLYPGGMPGVVYFPTVPGRHAWCVILPVLRGQRGAFYLLSSVLRGTTRRVLSLLPPCLFGNPARKTPRP